MSSPGTTLRHWFAAAAAVAAVAVAAPAGATRMEVDRPTPKGGQQAIVLVKNDHKIQVKNHHKKFLPTPSNESGVSPRLQADDDATGNGPAIPEPSAALVFGAGLLIASGALRRRKATA